MKDLVLDLGCHDILKVLLEKNHTRNSRGRGCKSNNIMVVDFVQFRVIPWICCRTWLFRLTRNFIANDRCLIDVGKKQEVFWCILHRSAVDDYKEACLDQIRHWMIRFYPQNFKTYLEKRASWQIWIEHNCMADFLVRQGSRKNLLSNIHILCIYLYIKNNSDKYKTLLDSIKDTWIIYQSTSIRNINKFR